MRLCFDSVDEVRDFVKNSLKAPPRGGKNSDEGDTAGGTAPAPLQPPPSNPGSMTAFAPQGQPQQFQPPGGFAPQGQPQQFAPQTGPDPAVAALVQRITPKIDWAVTPLPNGGGQPTDQVLNWFRAEAVKAGVQEAAQADLNQIKNVCLYKMPVAALEGIAKLMNA